MARAHSIHVMLVDRKDYIRDLLRMHDCTVARHRQQKRAVDDACCDVDVGDELIVDDTEDDPEFPTVCSFGDKIDMVKEWQYKMSLAIQQQGACAVCAYNYYGHERLPSDVQTAFAQASAYDLMLVSRARASQITHFYAYKPSGHWMGEEGSQRYNRGNVAIRPQDTTQLRDMLPPSRIKQMHPVLVTKSTVKTLIDFLLANNPWYQQCGVSYSQENMDSLFEECDADLDSSVPQALDICHLPRDNEMNEDSGLEPRDVDAPEDAEAGDIVIEAVGFTKGDHSSISKEKMKLHVLAYVLDHNKFILSKAGSRFISDNDPGLMSFLFPHLDPWDIGGFYHTGRTAQQYLSMEAQVKNLLRQDNLPFRSDPNFAFICWNMIQKKEVSRNTTFRISSSMQHDLAQDLKDVAPSLTSLAEKWTHSVNAKPSTTQEKKAA
ncbi:hypothetical protein EDB19DRAFT_1831227 [Suillus lakei]|nr:hypothetical protein EDB19DRAFT_1831227 [Suillus lakei]